MDDTVDSVDYAEDSIDAEHLAANSVSTTSAAIDTSYAGTGILGGGASALGFDCSEVEGTGINCESEAITLDATGDWTGTLDSIEGASFLRSDAADVYNDDGSDVDLRFEGVGEENALFLQGSDGYIGIGNAAPALSLEVGDITAGIDAVDGVGIAGDLEVEDFGLIGALRVGSTGTDPGAGNAYFEGTATVDGAFF